MTNETHPANATGHGDFERRDIKVSDVIYFLVGLVVFLVIVHFIVTGVYSYLEKHSQADQPPLSPLVKNAPADTRHLSVDYKDYLKQNFPSPQLEVDERTQLNQIRLDEEETLASYGYIDQKAGIVRIPIERAMDLIAQRGLPARSQSNAAEAASTALNATAKAPAKKDTKGTKKK
jgi:hypothetical protein